MSRVPARGRDHVPAGPLLRHVEARGGAAACGVRQHSAEEKALDRARRSGQVTYWLGDQLAVRLLGITALELWGEMPVS